MLALCVSPSAAAEKSKKPDAATLKAKRHNAAAKKLFSLGLFREAADEYQRAYQAKPHPSFLFNLAQCYKRLTKEHNLERALFYFQSYLKNAPFTPIRDNVYQEISRLKKSLRDLRRPPPFYKRWWFWAAVGVAVTAATIGTAVALQPEDQQPVVGTAPPGTIPMP